MLLLAFALSCLAMAVLGLAMSRHHKALLGGTFGPVRQRALLVFTAFGLGLALALCWNARGGIGAVFWLCLVMLAGLLVATLLAWRERWLLPLVLGLPLAGGVGLMF